MAFTYQCLGNLCILIVVIQFLTIFLRILYSKFIGPFLNNIDLARMGKWAVVTGSTDGLGKAYAELLARKGMNIVLISRTQSKLEEVASSIEKIYKVQTKIIVADFVEGESVYHNIQKQLAGIEIGVLVNNVGMSYPHPEYFLNVNDKDQLYSNIIRCNIFSVTNMCKIVMPGMAERRKGVVLNIASTAALAPSPLLTIYGASKAYVLKFSEDIATEYSKHGIIVQCVLPGYVATKMSKVRSASWMVPTPNEFVKHAIQTVGVESSTTGYFPHSLLIAVGRTVRCISPAVEKWLVFKTMEGIRAKALRKHAL